MKKMMISILAAVATLAIGCGGSGSSHKTTPPTIPAAPTGLAATAGDSQVALAWTAASGATSYNVYYSTTTGVTTANGTKVSGISSTSYTKTGLTDGTPYFFIVTAVNSAGESAASAQVTSTPAAALPAAPTGLVATPGDTQVALSWTAATGATSYNLYYSTTSPVTVSSGTKVGSISGASYTVTGLTDGQIYYFIVTAVNGGGESTASTPASATPTSGSTVTITPGTPTSTTVAFGGATSLKFDFAAGALSQSATATITPVAQADLTVPMSLKRGANRRIKPMVSANDTFIAAFEISLDPPSITLFNIPVGVSGTVDVSFAAGDTLNLAMLENNAWVDVATFLVGANGAFTEQLGSTTLPGLLAPGTYLFYKPAVTTTVSNLGVALIADDGGNMADGFNGLQVIHLYDANGNLLTTPTISYLDYANASDLDGQALTPDGSQGIMVDGGNTVRFFSAVQTGVPIASTTTVDISNYGGDGDSIAILPNGDEAVVSGDASNELVVISGILSGNPVAATTIATPDYRDGLVISNDGTVLLARGGSGVTVYSVTALTTPVAGTIGGTVAHSYTEVVDLSDLGTQYDTEDGRDGMAISPTDPSRAVVVLPGSASIELVTALNTATPVEGTAVQVPSGVFPTAVSISTDGKLAIVGTGSGLLMYSGVDTGTLVQVGTAAYAPTYSVGSYSVTLGNVPTLGITLDNKYVVAADGMNGEIVVIPFTSAGFADAPASALGGVTIPYNDQLLIH